MVDNAAGPTNAAGRYTVRGFCGDYEVTVPAGGKSTSRRVTLFRGGVTLRVTLS